jgi:hypothetical protein
MQRLRVRQSGSYGLMLSFILEQIDAGGGDLLPLLPGPVKRDGRPSQIGEIRKKRLRFLNFYGIILGP